MSEPKKFIVITTIHNPSEAVKQFRTWPDWQVVVVGDCKTPSDWVCDRVVFLGIEKQYKLFGDFAHRIPENSYTRKMLGYVYAICKGADVIFETDDDNIPYPGARECIETFLMEDNRFSGERYSSISGWINIYELFGNSRCWPRGFPIQFIKEAPQQRAAGLDDKPWGVVQFLADEDPDVDAIFRMVHGGSFYFEKDRKIIPDEGAFCPFNSQATLWTRDVFPLMFLPLGVSDRVTDILRGYIATSALWQMGHSVLYASPIVYQNRNSHNLHKDFLQEIPLYVNAELWCSRLRKIKSKNPTVFYRTAIRMLERDETFSMDNLTAYDLFLKNSGLI